MINAESQATDAHQQTAERIRHLATEHHTLDARLHELETHLHLTDDETLEESRIKKRKLALKDEISRLGHEA
ncbi:MAG: YdcH family protein [Vicinamibacterales bacterium]